ncbi:hypothetical protein C0991_004610 [Blastosporella zonata]|nr:hypothetical protein C0991_004610 [Blastosporella zonata]
MKFTTLASTTSLLAFALIAHAQIANPAAADTTTALADPAATATTTALATDATSLNDGTTDSPGTTTTPLVSALSSKVSSLLASTALAGAPGAPGAAGTPGSPGGAGVVPAPPVSAIRPTAIQPTGNTATPVRPSFFPTLTSGAGTFSTNAAQRPIGMAGEGTVYALLGAVIWAMF